MSEQNEKAKAKKPAKAVHPQPKITEKVRFMSSDLETALKDAMSTIREDCPVQQGWREYSILDIVGKNTLNLTEELVNNSVRVLEEVENNLSEFYALTQSIAQSSPPVLVFGFTPSHDNDIDNILTAFSVVYSNLRLGFGYLYNSEVIEDCDDIVTNAVESRTRLGNTLRNIVSQLYCSGFLTHAEHTQLMYELDARIISRPETNRLNELMQVFDTLLAVHSVTTAIISAL